MNEKRAGGVLFSNKKPNMGANAPAYTGKLTLDAELVEYIQKKFDGGEDFVELDLAGWKKTSSKGTTFLSLSVKPGYEGAPAKPAARKPQSRKSDYDDEVPF